MQSGNENDPGITYQYNHSREEMTQPTHHSDAGEGEFSNPSEEHGFEEGDEDLARQQDLSRLHILCEHTSDEDPETWEAVREWLETHSPADAQLGAQQQGEFLTSSLHLACRNRPPADIVESLLAVAPEVVRWTDSFGWLPLHYACANGASEDVLQILVSESPDSTIAVDKRGRTPLHFALGNTRRPATPQAVVLLSSTGAAECPDENGMLPLHYACAYGASEEALKVLLDAFPGSITSTDNKGRSPLHFALGNADRPASPAVVKLLLSQDSDIVNITDKDGGQLPLHLLATRAATITPDKINERDYAAKCLDLYLNAEPNATADFLTALQSLPEWLRDIAVVTPVVQEVFNQKISQRFPTAFLMLDFYFLVAIIIAFTFGVNEIIDYDFAPGATPKTEVLAALYICAAYFVFREIVQVMSLMSLGLFKTWLTDWGNWLDVLSVFLVLFWTVKMHTGNVVNEQFFRAGTALSLAVFWSSVLFFLKSTIIDFAVFVGGVFFVVQRLVAFLMALCVILIAFAMMFVTVFQETEQCQPQDTPTDSTECVSEEDPFPFCEINMAILKTYTMLLGEVSDSDFVSSKVAVCLFVLFMFLVVILLANVLIAIVTDSYGVIKNERAAIVFWGNRLDFVAEMDAIAAGPWKKKVRALSPFSSGGDGEQEDTRQKQTNDTFGREAWNKLISLFDDEELDFFSIDFYAYFFLRFVTVLFIVFVWLPIGLVSAGWLWPPQVREYLFQQRVSKRSHSDLKEAEQRSIEVEALSREVKDLQEEIILEMTADRTEVVAMKSQLTDMKEEMMAEMKHIKQIVTNLFDLQSSVEMS